MIVTGEVSLVGLSRVLLLGSPLESPNTGSELPGQLLCAPLGLWFGSEASRCICSFRRLIDYHEATNWAVDISFLPPSGAFISYKINPLRYYQLMEFITLSISPNWLISTSGSR